MTTIYVQEQGALVAKRNQQIIISRGAETLRTLPLEQIDQVVLMGRGVQISTALLVELLQRGVPVTLTSQSGTRHYATLSAGPSRFGDLRTRQTLFTHDPTRALELARQIVAAKLANQQALLSATRWPAATSASTQIVAAARGATTAADVDTLRGFEGSAAAAYFGAWRAALPPGWGFAGRAFYPPPDPINAMLSFGYTLLLHEMLTAIQIVGLDPYLGTFHALEAGRPSLALDLIEEFRPLLIDRLVLDVVREGALDRQRFGVPPERPGAVYLDAPGRALLIDRFQALLALPVRLPTGEQTPLRRVILLQAQQVARVMRGEQPRYTGFTIAP